MRFQECDQTLALNRAMPLPLNKHEPTDGLFRRHEEASLGAMKELCHPKAYLKRAVSKFLNHVAAAQ
jgi:hypothetical protein